MMKQRILFVCLGNICRSSSAEEIMRTLVRRAGREKEFEIDSAGISGFHEGELPDERMRAHASRRGYQLTHRSRPVRTEDFYHFDWILGMDDRNIDALRDKAPDVESEQKIHRMTDFCRTKVIDYVPNPIMEALKASRMCSTYWKMRVKDCWRICPTKRNNLKLIKTRYHESNHCTFCPSAIRDDKTRRGSLQLSLRLLLLPGKGKFIQRHLQARDERRAVREIYP